MVIVIRNALQTSIDLTKLFAILFVPQKGFDRQGSDEQVEMEEDARTVKRSSKFIEIS